MKKLICFVLSMLILSGYTVKAENPVMNSIYEIKIENSAVHITGKTHTKEEAFNVLVLNTGKSIADVNNNFAEAVCYFRTFLSNEDKTFDLSFKLEKVNEERLLIISTQQYMMAQTINTFTDKSYKPLVTDVSITQNGGIKVKGNSKYDNVQMYILNGEITPETLEKVVPTDENIVAQGDAVTENGSFNYTLKMCQKKTKYICCM